MGLIVRLLVAFCVATVLTQAILIGFFAARGTLTVDSITQMVALANGIDISGQRVQRALQQSDQREQPDFDDVLRQRTLASTEMDLRLRSQRSFEDELTRMLEELKVAEARFDQRREAFERRLVDVERDAQEAGLKELQRTLQALPAEQAKVQLLKFYDENRLDDVVNIVQGIPLDVRKDIMAEFVQADEAEKLYNILSWIGDGKPLSTYIDEAKQGR